MTNEEYLPFEEVFRRDAMPLMKALRADLIQLGYPGLDEVDVVDHDVSRGLGFQNGDGTLYAELMLEDGSSHGYEGVGLVLSCSMNLSGQVWAPGNYSSDCSILSPEQISTRLEEFEVREIAQRIVREWQQVERVLMTDACGRGQSAR